MRFILIDKVKELEPNKSLKAVKNLSLAEEYLADHFPEFPVLPGVLLLEGIIESASWLVRQSTDYNKSMVLLKKARNVKYKSFLAPGTQIEYFVEAKKIEEDTSSFKGVGIAKDQPIVEARIDLKHFNLKDKNGSLADTDEKVIENLKQRWKLLYKNGKDA